MTQPITEAGPALARACNAAAANLPAERVVFRVEVTDEGLVLITEGTETFVVARPDTALAINVRGLLLAVKEGTIR